MHTHRGRRLLTALTTLGMLWSMLSAIPSAPVSAAGGLDPSFDGDGLLLSPLGHDDIYAQAVMVQPADQKVVVAGSVWMGDDWDFALLRYCPDGALDDGLHCGAPGFGAGGRVITDFGGGCHDAAMDALLQPDGKIVIGGVSYISTWGDFALARLCPDGALDDGVNCGKPGFGVGGKVRTDFAGSPDWVSALAVHNGKIIAGGSGGNKDFAVARYHSDGNLDSSFGGGKRTVSFGSGWDYGQDLTVQPDGKIIIAGGGYAADWNTDFGLARFKTDGTLDSSFSGDGKVLTEFFGYSDRILSVTMQGNQVLAVGYATNCYGEDLALARYSANGSPDASFDGDGKTTTDFGGYYDAAAAVAVQTDGSVVVTGHSGDDPGGEAISLARYQSDGSLDGAFGGDGKVTTDAGSGHHLGYGLAATGGYILVAGWANEGNSHDFALARLADDGNLDTGFATGGLATADFDGGDDLATAMAVQRDGKTVLVGRTLQGSTSDFAVARYCPDGQLDDGLHCGSPGFGLGGMVTSDFGGEDSGRAILVQPDGRIVVAGTTRACPDSDFAVARYNADGSPDITFDGDGQATTDFATNWDEGVGLALQPDGKLVVVGETRAAYATADFALVRYCPSGQLDDGVHCGSPGFGVGGRTTTDFAGNTDGATAAAVLADGKIVVAGEAYAGGNDFALVRYCPDGTLDDGLHCGAPGWGTEGKTTSDFFGEWDRLAALLLLPDGTILVGGTASRGAVGGGWDEDLALALYRPDGSPDGAFSDDGLETADFGAKDELGQALALQADGKILISGESGGRLAIGRYLSTLPPTPASTPTATPTGSPMPKPSATSTATALPVLPLYVPLVVRASVPA